MADIFIIVLSSRVDLGKEKHMGVEAMYFSHVLNQFISSLLNIQFSCQKNSPVE